MRVDYSLTTRASVTGGARRPGDRRRWGGVIHGALCARVRRWCSPRTWGAIALFIVPTVWAQTPAPYVVSSTVNNCLSVRSDHATSAATVACLPAGTPVTVIASAPFWREISFGINQRGWAAKKYLEPIVAPIGPTVSDTGIPPDAFLEVHFVDVGQGDAIWIHTHDDGIAGNDRFEGYNVVIDGGPYAADTRNPLLPYLEGRAHHGADIEALIITHPHTDHFRGAESISRHFDVQHYYDPGFPSTLASYGAFLDAMQGANGTSPRARHVHLGRDAFGPLNWGSELRVDVLYAYPGDPRGLGSGNTRVNNSSIVLRLAYGHHVFLFMGDAEGKDRDDPPATPKYVEARLLRTVRDQLPATVLKLGHHGSETSSTLPFIEAVNPQIVVVQSGRKSFGGTFIPDLTTLQRYCEHNSDTRIYRTDQNDEAEGLSESDAADGDNVVIRSNGQGPPQVAAFEGGKPFNPAACAP